jgi:hypothetical protein
LRRGIARIIRVGIRPIATLSCRSSIGRRRGAIYTGFDLQRAIAISDPRAMSQRRLPRFALEYLKGRAQDELD